mgnify:CR=1 FL=1
MLEMKKLINEIIKGDYDKMLKTGNDIDIINELGKVDSEESAKAVFKKYMDDEQLTRLLKIKHPEVLKRIAASIVLCNPSAVFVNAGSSEDRQFIRTLALAKKRKALLPWKGIPFIMI